MPELSPTQETVLFGLRKSVHNEESPVTAREVADFLGRDWTQQSVYQALGKLAEKGRVQRVGWSGTSRTWEPTGAGL